MAPRATRASTRKTRADIDPNTVESRLAPIGSVESGISKNVDTVKADDEKEKKVEESKEEVEIHSVAALRAWHNKRGTSPTTEEINKTREVENKIAEEGGKLHRTNKPEK